MAIVEILPDGDLPNENTELWTPRATDRTVSLLCDKFPGEEDLQRNVLSKATKILKKCLPPDSQPDERTVLVVGRIQSGKTLSFTALASLAGENGYRLIIVLAATTR